MLGLEYSRCRRSSRNECGLEVEVGLELDLDPYDMIGSDWVYIHRPPNESRFGSIGPNPVCNPSYIKETKQKLVHF